MIFWLGILISLTIAALAAKRGLYESWTIFFNVIISVYLGITLAPVLQDLLSLGDSPTSSAIVTLLTAIACFGLLYGVAFIIFLSQFEVKFPKALDAAGGGLTGFLATMLAWGFIVFVIFTSPMGQKNIFKSIGFDAESAKTDSNVAYMKWWAGMVDGIVGKGKEHNRIDTLVAKRIKEAVKPEVKKAPEPEKEIVEEEKPEEEIKPSDLGPPPELAFEDI